MRPFILRFALLMMTVAPAACVGNRQGSAASVASAGAGGGTGGGNGPNDPTPSTPSTPGMAVAGGNPFADTVMYVSADYGKQVDANAAMLSAAGISAQTLAAVKAFPTGIWLDRIAAIAGGDKNGGRLGLAGHFDAALAQAQTQGKPAVVLLVVYDLPDRDCKAKASNGELHGLPGLATYKMDYIDAIVSVIKSKPEYAKLHIAMVIEPDSLPNMVTNKSIPACAAVAQDKLYEQGVVYALSQFSKLDNVSMYIDIAHSGWLGWEKDMDAAVAFFMDILSQANGNMKGVPKGVRGFAANVANYTPTQEPFVKPSDMAMRDGAFYQFNPIWDESTYVATLADKFIAAGFSGGIGFLIDTSRNGWPKLDDGKPIDRRKARGNWCNVGGTGLGERPVSAPAGHRAVDAFVYVKPPGESDGYATLQNKDNLPDAEGKRFDADCDPTIATTDALTKAPGAGNWFQEAFLMLVKNATPKL